jgi:hypothetical protein
MSLWRVTQTTTRQDTGQVWGPDYVTTVDDTQTNLNGKIMSYFGNEKNSAVFAQVSADVWTATVQFTPTANKAGWVRDQTNSFEYVVVLRAERVA